ncbi:MAG: PQQ-binding-like beta-propeller repeat protein [Kosmotoga sp.]|nr:PQQ-binding-like beta-propeller repeat protein [Kosmotoga sp.]MBO8165623.1 PQQ-binding-like beta-propeller repeat protein [Kosmotoga sp.]
MRKGAIILALVLILVGTMFATEIKINTVSAKPMLTGPGGRVFLRCEAVGDGILSYKWNPEEGKIIRDYKNGTAVWRAPEAPGAYSIRVEVVSNAGTVEGEVVVKVMRPEDLPNHPPEIQLLYPDNGKQLSVEDDKNGILLLWYSSDEDGDYLFYDVYLSDSLPFDSPWMVDHDRLDIKAKNLKGNTKYYWKVVAKDGRGGQAESDVFTFKTANHSPRVILEDVTIDEEHPLKLNLLDFASDEDGDPLSFELLPGSVGEIEGTGYVYTPTYASSGTYRVAVKVSDGELTSSDDFILTVKNVDRKPQVFLSSPATDTETSTEVTFKWSVADPDIEDGSDRKDYVRSTVYYGTSEEELTSFTTDQTEYKAVLDPHSDYYWKVKVEDAYGLTAESNLIHFKTRNSLPCVSKIAVELNETEKKVIDLDAFVHDPDGDKVEFVLSEDNPEHLGLSLEKSVLTLNPDYEAVTTVEGSKEFTVNLTAMDVQDSVKFSVKVIVNNVNRPPMVELVEPGDNSVIDAEEVTLSWTAVDPDSDPLHYDLFFRANEMPKDAFDGFTWLSETSATVKLQPHTKYFWKVEATDGATVVSSQLWSFTTVNHAPVAMQAQFNLPEPGENDKHPKKYRINFKGYFQDPDEDRIIFEKKAGIGTLDEDGNFCIYVDNVSEIGADGTENMPVSAGEYEVTVVAKDDFGGVTEITYPIIISDTNVSPVVTTPEMSYVSTDTEYVLKALFTWTGSDLDNDKLTYTFHLKDVEIGETTTIEGLCESQYTLDIKPHTKYECWIEATDLRETDDSRTSKSGVLSFESINRLSVKPVSPVAVKEGEEAEIVLPQKDIDGDEITYSVEGLVVEGNKISYKPDYDVVSHSNPEITSKDVAFKGVASDGYDNVEITIPFRVIDVNRDPVIELISPERNAETSTDVILKWNATDPDGDAMKYIVSYGPSEENLVEVETINTDLTVTGLELGRSYLWKVKAVDLWSVSNSAETAFWQFAAVILEPKWCISTDDLIYSSAAVKDGSSIFVGIGRKLYAFDKATGNKLWTFKANDTFKSSPVIDDYGNIYIGDKSGYLYSVRPDGDLNWTVKLNGGIESTLVINGDKQLFIGTTGGLFYSLNTYGEILWQKPLGKVVSSAAISEDGTIYVGTSYGKLYSLNPEGVVNWTFEASDWIEADISIAENGDLVFGSDDGHLYRVNKDGELVWKFYTGDPIRSGVAISEDGTIYFGGYDNKFYALNSDGGVIWSFETGGPIHSTPAIAADGTVIFGSLDGTLYALRSNGELYWKWKFNNWLWASPLITEEGIVYVGSHDRRFCAFDAENGGLARGFWPKFRLNAQNNASLMKPTITKYIENLFEKAGSLYFSALEGVKIDTGKIPGAKVFTDSKTGEKVAMWELSAKELEKQLKEPSGIDLTGINILFATSGDNLFFGVVGEDQLDLLAVPANSNAYDFDGNLLPMDEVGKLIDAETVTEIRTTLFGALAFQEYVNLYKTGAVLEGPSNYVELFKQPLKIDNISGQEITLTRAWLINIDLKDIRLESEMSPIYREWNALWQPKIETPSFGRLVNFGSSDVLNSSVYIKAFTDNIDAPYIKIDGVKEEDDTVYRKIVLLRNEIPKNVELSSVYNLIVTKHVVSGSFLGGSVLASSIELPSGLSTDIYQPQIYTIRKGISVIK